MVFSYFGFGSSNTTSKKDELTAVRALPASWYTSQEMYELERRAIFSRKWLLATHSLRVKQPGDFLRMNIAGYDFVISRNRTDKINAFHNVCRHRAYPVVEKQEGNAKILACRYHGWSYGLNGRLAKAPGYSDLSGFDKSQNGLLPIHVHIDVNGFIWINMDSSPTPENAWEDDFLGVDTQKRYETYNFSDYDFDHTWEIDAHYNWKLGADNYNECYHCLTTHPDLQSLANLETYDVRPEAGHIQHDPQNTEAQKEADFRVATTWYFPNSSTNILPQLFFIQRFSPKSPTESKITYEVYRNRQASDDAFKLVDTMYKRVMGEDKVLCDAAQRNLSTGIFINGEMHPKMEKGPLFFQKSVRDTVTAHHKREQQANQEIWPARPKLPASKNSLISQEDIDFCSGLTCSANRDELVW
ncbi:ISP domain-containing protein [Myriangium duriaei CBS 260.36]|uniref:Choline monooxygenase, chloroplastic n=1 Tax=Myriangium duriaei CBS 260.36 TaxID=1168546 RepID=A0A9P4J3A8_9PEZI|nr:ISP domain-containing protein [Myriangium duriaei CBS 260.36]